MRIEGLRRRQEELAAETRDRLARPARERQAGSGALERILAFVAIALAGLALAVALANSGRASQSSVDSVSRQVATLDDRVSSTGSQVDSQVQTAIERYLGTHHGHHRHARRR